MNAKKLTNIMLRRIVENIDGFLVEWISFLSKLMSWIRTLFMVRYIVARYVVVANQVIIQYVVCKRLWEIR